MRFPNRLFCIWLGLVLLGMSCDGGTRPGPTAALAPPAPESLEFLETMDWPQPGESNYGQARAFWARSVRKSHGLEQLVDWLSLLQDAEPSAAGPDSLVWELAPEESTRVRVVARRLEGWTRTDFYTWSDPEGWVCTARASESSAGGEPSLGWVVSSRLNQGPVLWISSSVTDGVRRLWGFALKPDTPQADRVEGAVITIGSDTPLAGSLYEALGNAPWRCWGQDLRDADCP